MKGNKIFWFILAAVVGGYIFYTKFYRSKPVRPQEITAPPAPAPLQAPSSRPSVKIDLPSASGPTGSLPAQPEEVSTPSQSAHYKWNLKQIRKRGSGSIPTLVGECSKKFKVTWAAADPRLREDIYRLQTCRAMVETDPQPCNLIPYYGGNMGADADNCKESAFGYRLAHAIAHKDSSSCVATLSNFISYFTNSKLSTRENCNLLLEAYRSGSAAPLNKISKNIPSSDWNEPGMTVADDLAWVNKRTGGFFHPSVMQAHEAGNAGLCRTKLCAASVKLREKGACSSLQTYLARLYCARDLGKAIQGRDEFGGSWHSKLTNYIKKFGS